jgi:hypothetical protein
MGAEGEKEEKVNISFGEIDTHSLSTAIRLTTRACNHE